MKKRKVLFICAHNMARSQMAEAWLNHLAPESFEADSGGVEPADRLNPIVIKVMMEAGIDISHKVPASIYDKYSNNKNYDYYISVCSRDIGEVCPVCAAADRCFNWPFKDPSKLTGSAGEQAVVIRDIRDKIKKKVEEFIEEYGV